MRQALFRILRIAAGIFFLLMTVVGSLLPILQGWLFFALAVLCLAPEVPPFRRLLCWIQKKSPRTRGPIRKWKRFFYRKEGKDPEKTCPPEN